VATSITIDDMDGKILERLRAEAERRGVDIGTVVRELLNEALGPVTKETSTAPHHDLDALAGTWSDEEADSFLSTIADFDRVDEDLWK